jgi:hypothetical protein
MRGILAAMICALAALLAPAAAQAQYGAVAYSHSTGAGGVALNQPTEEAARARAMSSCRGSGCAVQQIVPPGQCLAVCMGVTRFGANQPTETFQWGVGATRQEAVERARTQCRVMFGGTAESRGERVGCNPRAAAPARAK